MIPNSKGMIEKYLGDFKDLFPNVKIQKKLFGGRKIIKKSK